MAGRLEVGDWLKADCLFAQGELLGALSWQPWRSHIVPICPISDLKIYSLPPFCANNHFLPFCFPYNGSYQGAHILKMFECRQNWWMGRCCFSRPASALEDQTWRPASEEAPDSLQEHGERLANGDNPASSSLGRNIVSERRDDMYHPIYSIGLKIVYGRVWAPWKQWIFIGHDLRKVKDSCPNDLCWLPQYLQTCLVRFILWCQTPINYSLWQASPIFHLRNNNSEAIQVL